MFAVKNISFSFGNKKILDDISFEIKKGEFAVIFGRNGTGKSTLAKLLAALELPGSGDVFVDGINTKDFERNLEIRRKVGFTFQNPDDQIVAGTVEDDVAFGLENLRIENPVLRQLTDEAMKCTEIYEQRESDINTLSGGNKQKTAFSGVIAMGSECLILDEPTSMLDFESRKNILNQIFKLKEKKQLTVVLLTHHLDEASLADKIFVLSKNQTFFSNCKEIYNDKLKSIDNNNYNKISKEFCGNLNENGAKLVAQGSPNELKKKFSYVFEKTIPDFKKNNTKPDELAIQLIDVFYNHKNGKTVFKNLNLDIYKNEIIGLLGKTGSGKSTLAYIIKGLLKIKNGKIKFGNKLSDKDNFSKIGIVFQYPENQLFEETVLKDVMFGPKNLKFDEEIAKKKALKALEMVGFDKNKIYNSPFKLSGGEKRLAAIAGILAMEPKILILDEPTAGLDIFSKHNFLNLIVNLNNSEKNTIIFISHSHEDLKLICGRIFKIKNGVLNEIDLHTTRKETVFARKIWYKTRS
ncbi:MAG: ATP-binding cassette domain-containing protein [Oscillospiraceae bacterium]|jgi:energy-coupling factor transport system ATP-binding protein|nr:ATP-binding cassette domain-containing protein [Oscillospiraceae bacterium]